MRIAVFQMTSVLSAPMNMVRVRSAALEAKAGGAEALFLPECFHSISDGTAPSPHAIVGHDENYQAMVAISREAKIALIGGSAATKVDGEIRNRAYNFDAAGNDLGFYDKRHLFACDIKRSGEEKRIDEADIYKPGSLAKTIELGPLKIGLGICFDLRYPIEARRYVEGGANLLTFSSAFTVPTGKAHWHVLNRARAIENQCFVVSAAQWGKHNDRIQTFGHSLVIDPWGEVLVDAGEGEKVVFADLDITRVSEVRSSVKVF
jgi:predicted amidohydrolase